MHERHSTLRTIGYLLLAILLVYLLLGTGFHFAWKTTLNSCREDRLAQGDFVEPEVFAGGLGYLFDVTFWPVYAQANIYHDGTPFATRCTK
jgi:hypothetical protein